MTSTWVYHEENTSASPAGHGAPKATEHSGGPGMDGNGRGYDPQHLPYIGLYTPATRYLLATRVCVGYLVVCYSQIGALSIYRSGIPLHNDRMASRSFIFRKFLCGTSEILCLEKLRSQDIHRARTLLSATTPDPYPTENAPLARQ